MDSFDFWYAVNNTEVVQGPEKNLETFGTTMFEYHLITELMDSVDCVRVREGRIEAAQPQIITPQDFGDLPLEGFDDDQASAYVNWLRQNAAHLRVIQYGFNIRKQEIKSFDVTEPLPQVLANVRAQVAQGEHGSSAIVLGVEQPWEVCLLKLIVDLVEQSSATNVEEMRQKNLFAPGPDPVRKRVDDAFLCAARDASRIGELHELLQREQVFSEYEDRFFALVRASQAES